MTFPQTPQTLKVCLFVNSTWSDISGDVYERDGITINRGKSEYAQQAAPARCALTLDNRAGKYSPRNPLSTYYGQLGRNTRLKVFTEYATNLVGFISPNQTDSAITAPDSVATSITGDIDIRTDVEEREQIGNAYGTRPLVTKWNTTGNQRTYTLSLIESPLAVDCDQLVWAWSSAGTATTGTATSDPFSMAILRRPGRRVTFRVTFDVDNGAAGNTATFYYGESVDGPWTQIGSPIVTAGTTSLFNSTATTAFGSDGVIGGDSIYGNLYAGKILNGIGGTVVASPTLTSQTPGASSFVDAQGNTWTKNAGGGSIGLTTRSDVRFMGEVSSFPAKWDTSGNDAYVPIEAAAITRRLGQGVDPADSGLRAFTQASAGLYNYWPLGGAAGTQYSLDVGGDTTGSRRFYSEGAAFQYGQDMSPYLGTGMALFNSTAGPMRADVGSPYNYAAIDFVFQSTELGTFSMVAQDYSAFQWTVNFTAGVAQVSFTDPDVGPIGFSPTGILSALTDTNAHHCRLELLKNGTATDWALYIDGVSVDTGSQASYNLDGLARFRFYYTRTGTQNYVILAHLTAWSAASQTWPTAADCALAAFGYAGETAGRRIERICDVAGVTFLPRGDLDSGVPMGPQYSESLLSQLRDAETADMGILFEPREGIALAYIPLAALYNQTAVLALDYSTNQVAPPFEPVDDDQNIRNEVTATRRDGGSYKTSLTTGSMSTLAPESGGVGRYRDDYTANVQTDGVLPSVAGWQLNLGTVDEARFSKIKVNLASPGMYNSLANSIAAHTVDVGDVITVDNADAANFYDLISQLVLGYEEYLNVYAHTIDFNCTPASPYSVAVYGSGVGTGPDRYDTDGSALTSGITTTGTSLSVSPTGAAGVLWTNAAAEFPFDIRVGGERMTVTNITSATAPQTFTVTRSVNGVVKAHLTGAAVALWRTPRYAL